MQVNIAVEGMTDEPVARKLVMHAGLEVGEVYGREGKTSLLKSLRAYNQAARFWPWFVLVDLDADRPCPSEALTIWLPVPAAEYMRFRIVVQAVETWLMADREHMAAFLGVSLAKIPQQVELERIPKQTLINIARTSRNKSIREDIVLHQGSSAKVGDRYIPRLLEFTTNYWRPDEAAKHSESLRRCIKALSTLHLKQQ